VNEGNFGKLAAPLSGNTDTTAQGGDHVAEFLPTVEAFVGVGPDTVHRVDSLGFSEDILEVDLQMVIDVVGITVNKIEFCHFEILK